MSRSLNKELQPIEEHVRYLFVEDVPQYGRRPLGRVTGYDSIEELKRDMRHNIESNTKQGFPTYIMEVRFKERLV